MKCNFSRLKALSSSVKWTDRGFVTSSSFLEADTAGALSNDIPHFLCCVAEFATRHTGAETVVADTDRIVFELVCEVITPLCHRSNEHADALSRAKGVDIILDTYYRGIETQGDLPTVGRQVIGDGIFDDLQQLLLRIRGADGKSME